MTRCCSICRSAGDSIYLHHGKLYCGICLPAGPDDDLLTCCRLNRIRCETVRQQIAKGRRAAVAETEGLTGAEEDDKIPLDADRTRSPASGIAPAQATRCGLKGEGLRVDLPLADDGRCGWLV
jgi:hypothetical protein